MKQKYCPSCGEPACPPYGHSEDFLIVGESPGDLEMIKGQPFATSPKFTTAGKVFRKELQRVGFSLSDFRVMNLWMHEPNKNENCFRAGYESVLEEARGKKAILLVGSDVVTTFTDFKVSEVNGLEVDSPLLGVPHIMAMTNPALALHRAFGEVRFAIEQWAKLLEELHD